MAFRHTALDPVWEASCAVPVQAPVNTTIVVKSNIRSRLVIGHSSLLTGVSDRVSQAAPQPYIIGIPIGCFIVENRMSANVIPGPVAGLALFQLTLHSVAASGGWP